MATRAASLKIVADNTASFDPKIMQVGLKKKLISNHPVCDSTSNA